MKSSRPYSAPHPHFSDSMVPTRCGRLHIRSIGTGRPTVLWPSMFVDAHTWDDMVPLLLPGRRLHLVDGPGLGESDPLTRPSSIPDAADAALDLLDELGVAEPVDWLGNAFGGHVGYELARRAGRLRSLVAVSAPTEPIDPALRRRIGLLKPLLRAFGPVGVVRGAILSAMVTEASARDVRIVDVVDESLRRPARASMVRALESFILNRVDVTGDLPGFSVPALFVSSDDRGDWSPEAAERAARLARAEHVIVEGARTLVPLEQPHRLAAEVLGFWRRVDGRTA